MRKIHITLVGGQPMPVYLGITYCKPDKVLFIYSKDSEKQKQSIKNGIIENKIIAAVDILKSDPLNPVDMTEIESVANEYKEKFANDEISLNISGGTKAWSYFFAKVFENVSNAKIIYIDQNNEVYNLKEKTHEKVQFDFMMQFKLNKNPLQVFTNFSEYTAADFSALKKIEELRKINIGVFTELTNLDRKKEKQLNNQVQGRFQTKDASLDWDKSGRCVVSIKHKDETKKEIICSPNITKIIFNASWFELKVAHIISQWPKAKQIFLNCKFIVNTTDTRLAKKFPKNEIDIIVDTGDKALFVECKTNVANTTDIDKFNTAVRNYGGSGSKALFVCLHKFPENARQKFSDCGNMLSYSFAESKDINSFYEMLDRCIDIINK